MRNVKKLMAVVLHHQQKTYLVLIMAGYLMEEDYPSLLIQQYRGQICARDTTFLSFISS